MKKLESKVNTEKSEGVPKSWKRSEWPGSKQGNQEAILIFDSPVRF